jgi:hypothetical protein
MQREIGHVVSPMKTLSLDNERQRYVDVCDACKRRYAIEDKEYINRRVKVAEKALSEKKNIDGNASLEDAL